MFIGFLAQIFAILKVLLSACQIISSALAIRYESAASAAADRDHKK